MNWGDLLVGDMMINSSTDQVWIVLDIEDDSYQHVQIKWLETKHGITQKGGSDNSSINMPGSIQWHVIRNGKLIL